MRRLWAAIRAWLDRETAPGRLTLHAHFCHDEPDHDHRWPHRTTRCLLPDAAPCPPDHPERARRQATPPQVEPYRDAAPFRAAGPA